MVNFKFYEIFIKNFGGVARGLKFQKLKIHHNQQLIMKFSSVLPKFEKILIFFEKCKQTAEISWPFFSAIVAQKIS